jgi:molecular chaperone Hsp33
MMSQDFFRPFLFEHLDIRGAFARLGPSWRDMRTGRDYPDSVARLLGEMTAVSVLISANLKQPGRLTFQLKGQGPVDLMVVDCDERLRLRGMARHAGVDDADSVSELLGDGQLVLTLDAAGMASPYQSLVPLAGESIAAIFEHYLERSEQQPTRLFLAADEHASAGLFLQRLPGAERLDADGWNRVQILAQTLGARELLDTPISELLTRTFPEEDIRLYDPRAVSYHCPEDWEKVRGMLQTLGRDECAAMLGEHGEIILHDDICNHVYRFDANDIETLFAPRTLH